MFASDGGHPACRGMRRSMNKRRSTKPTFASVLVADEAVAVPVFGHAARSGD